MATITNSNILLSHGSGGRLSQDLFTGLFAKYFHNPILDQRTDSAVLQIPSKHLAFTTDAYVVNPIFFPGASIGSLAICGTVNDLAVAGAVPLYISSAFILEEGLPYSDLEKIVTDMAEKAREAQVTIVAGDTKVVTKGACDKIFITTSGIGLLKPEHIPISTGQNIEIGDKILINGPIANHGMAILSKRYNLHLQTDLISDCAPLNHLIAAVLQADCEVHFMRDATRGGLATVLCECVEKKTFGMFIDEALIPVDENVRFLCEMFGFDPFYMANEGKVVLVVKRTHAEQVLAVMQQNPLGRHSAIIGEITEKPVGKVGLQTLIGGKRLLQMLAGDPLPRIC